MGTFYLVFFVMRQSGSSDGMDDRSDVMCKASTRSCHGGPRERSLHVLPVLPLFLVDLASSSAPHHNV